VFVALLITGGEVELLVVVVVVVLLLLLLLLATGCTFVAILDNGRAPQQYYL
jgi:hypothetical protein